MKVFWLHFFTGGPTLGQNLQSLYGYAHSWERAINNWYRESDNFKYGEHSSKTVGEYTQVKQASYFNLNYITGVGQ